MENTKLPSKGEYLCNFLDLASSDSPQLSAYASFFLCYDPRDWDRGSRGGAFSYQEQFERYELVLQHSQKFGVGFAYMTKGKCAGEWISVKDDGIFDEFEGDDSEGYLPVGSFLEPIRAWQVLKEFLANPKLLPRSCNWIESSKVVWPEF